jgi:hypothetical protein
MIGSAAFLLPDGTILPVNRWPPSTMYWMGGTCVSSKRNQSIPATPDHQTKSTDDL